MSGGVQLASGYISLSVKTDGAMKQLMAEITGIEKQADKSGQKAGEAISKGVSKGATKAGQTIHDAITAGAQKAGADAGKAAGEGLNKGISKGAKDAGKSVGDELTKATKRTGDSIVKDLGGSILEAARQGAKDAGTTLEAEIGKAAAKAGSAIGNAIGDSPLGAWVRSLGVDGDQVISVMDGIGKSITGVKNQDIGGTLTGVADALNGIGQSDAANVFEKLGTVAGNTQQSFRDIKGDIEDTATGLGLLATNSPKAAKGLESIGAAAGPIGLTVAAAKELDDALTELGVAKYAEVPGSALWFMHQLANGWSGVKDFLGATPFGGPDPTKGFQSPIQPKPGVSVIPLPGSAPAVEDGYTAVTGSMDPFAALAPASGAKAAPSGYAGDAALLANVPPGRYLQTQAADLTKGIGDCSSAVEDLINMLTGVSTAGRSLATGNAPQWLAQHGFVPTDKPVAGAFNVGFNSEHMQATLPGGTPFNWGSDAAAANRGIGGTGAWDPAFTQHYYRPVGFDDGGVLPPGMQVINNASGKPEIVLTQDQAQNALQGMPGVGAGPSDTPLSSGMSPGQNGAAALTSLLGQQPDGDPLAAVTNPGGRAQRTQGYIPAGAGGSGQAGTSLWSGAMQMGASAVNGLIEQAASAASTAISAAATAGSFGAGGQAGGAASQFLIGIGTKMAERGVQYGFQLAGIGGDALAEILLPFGVPRFFQTDPSQFMPQLPGQAAAVTTGEKAQGQQAGLQTPSPSGPVQPGQMPGQQPVGPSVPIATEGTGNFTPAPVGTPGLSPTASGPATPSVAAAPLGPQAPKSGPMAPQPDQPPVQPKKPAGPLDFVPLDMPGVFDTGGWLQPNGIAVNLSNKPEPILNAEQWGNLHAIAAQGMPELDPKAANGYAPNFSVNIDSVTVKDVNELQREIDSRQRLQMWRHAGRP
ncbi:hypothetical protein LTQ56_05610 [Mycobacterium intracellulare subsp. intracellulare]|uniref:hypothetical protein n=1 Tax=Mycobacterium intracellulare TaxID=1767 RepID=UPI000493E6B8|nr:hypothetical protein [Mycobacterium intracellulare]UGU08150.1 hypothetical protein LTQ56_05610 [Mycobacterium intracellulare subsp. intracellulare]BCO57172.1 hypothetical protein MINTM005_24160 [Mycobacterium intracellulare]BCO94276.1 hypothetical protein MINTM016_22520 [Mycobacterium intracellulare]